MIYPASPALLLIKNADYALARSLKMFPSGLKGNKRDIRVYNTRGCWPPSCLLCRRDCCFALFCSAATLFGPKENQIDGKQNLGQLPSSILIWPCGCAVVVAVAFLPANGMKGSF